MDESISERAGHTIGVVFYWLVVIGGFGFATLSLAELDTSTRLMVGGFGVVIIQLERIVRRLDRLRP